jgi:hypothetical protein
MELCILCIYRDNILIVFHSGCAIDKEWKVQLRSETRKQRSVVIFRCIHRFYFIGIREHSLILLFDVIVTRYIRKLRKSDIAFVR